MINKLKGLITGNDMADYELIKKVKNIDLTEMNKPKIDYTDFEVIVEGREVTIGIPVRETQRFETVLESQGSLNRRTFRALMRDFRGIRKGDK